MIVVNAWPSAVLIVSIPSCESNEVLETPATSTVDALSINPDESTINTGIFVAEP